MNERIHAGIATLCAVYVVVVLTARWWNTPVRDAAPYSDGDITVETPIAEFEWEPVYGVALELARGEGP